MSNPGLSPCLDEGEEVTTTPQSRGCEIDHECPWSKECHCLRDGSLCECTHQSGSHQPEWQGSNGCDDCDCERFERHGSHLPA